MLDCFIYEGYSKKELISKYVRHFKKEANKIKCVVGEDWTNKFVLNICH